MTWAPRWLGERYVKLYLEFEEEPFDFRAARTLLEVADEVLRNVLSQLHKLGYVSVFARQGRKKLYRLYPPDLAILTSQLGVRNLDTLKQGVYSHLLLKLAFELHRRYQGRLTSVVLFGSVARGTASAQSDVDVVTVIEGLKSNLSSRIGELLAAEHNTRVGDELDWLRGRGILTHISFHPYTPDEMRQFRMLFLDLVADGITVLDRGNFFESLRPRYRSFLEAAGAERRYVTEDEWYWVMDPEVELGEVKA